MAIILLSRLSTSKGLTAQVMAIVTAGVFLEVILVVSFRRIERRCLGDLRRNRTLPLARFIHLGFDTLGDLSLLFARIEYGRTILHSDVIVLLVQSGGVMNAEEIPQKHPPAKMAVSRGGEGLIKSALTKGSR